MQTLFKVLEMNTAVTSLLEKKGHFIVDDTFGIALLIATAYNKKPQNYSIIATNLYNAQKIYDLLSAILGEDKCLFYPADEMLRLDSIATSKEMLAQRLYVMDQLRKRQEVIMITHAAAIMRFLPSPSTFAKQVIEIEINKEYSLESIKRQLTSTGYVRVNKVDSSLQFALRGDILDIYSVNLSSPVRIEFFGNLVESIRPFDIATQRSLKDEINEVAILPANEILFEDIEKENAIKKINDRLAKDKERLNHDFSYQLEGKIDTLVANLQTNNITAEMHKYFGFLQNEHYSILDYSPHAVNIICNKTAVSTVSAHLQEDATDYLVESFENGQVLSHLGIYQDFMRVIGRQRYCLAADEFSAKEDDVYFPIAPVTSGINQVGKIFEYLMENRTSADKLVLALSTEQQCQMVKQILQENNVEYEDVSFLQLPKGQIGITLFALEDGFEMIKEKIRFLTSKELFGYRNRLSRYLNRYKEAVILKSYSELEAGDYIVHEQHGIGQFIDIKTLEVDGIHRDYLHIAYAGKDVLYVPLEQFKLIRRFIGKEGAIPKLNRLGSGEWEKTKNRIRERVSDMAERLIALYAERAQLKGFAFKEDDEFQRDFESRFPFELTQDQLSSINEIKEDMEKDTPMDRLLCGDVGFGKTEVAFRAAFKAILSGKQVAILCPTTLLARQHYERALERFSLYGIEIAIFSRLIPESKQKHYIEDIKNDKIHLVIGTHRLLSKEIKFANLGLLIIDEEQRFGVEQKERIKELKVNIDVLTLTATPIPRTLQMSLLAIKQLSQINTPPTNRMPIQTYVLPFKESIIKELIERELARNGQVFYLHNQVHTIYSVANKLQKQIKGALVAVVHGQMDRDDIEETMMKFYNGEISVLVCTSIIETGLDVPNANMIIVEEADKLGLSQLYQIKGRVGRGNRIAYAYLFFNEKKEMNENAKKRLKSIQDFTELGSGYKIAQRDLMIRGAGDILGPEQAGFIDTVGIDMYIQLLNEAIQNKQGQNINTSAEPDNIALTVDAFIPGEYANKSDKLELYQEIDAAKSVIEVETMEKKIRDIYGRIPNAVSRLLGKKKIAIYLQNNIFEALQDAKDAVSIILSKEFSNVSGIGMELFKSLSDYISLIKVIFVDRKIKIKFDKKGDWLTKLESLLEKIITTAEKYNN